MIRGSVKKILRTNEILSILCDQVSQCFRYVVLLQSERLRLRPTMDVKRTNCSIRDGGRWPRVARERESVEDSTGVAHDARLGRMWSSILDPRVDRAGP